MNVLPAGQSLHRFVPDLEELIENPRAYLAQEPLTIGPRQMYGLAFLFGLAGAAFLLSCLLLNPANRDELLAERLALGIGMFLGASVWLGWSLRMRGHSLVLHPEGVEVRYRDTTVWCPWALLNVTDGHAFVPGSDSPRVGLILPIAPEAVPFVELRREDTPVAHGLDVRAPQWHFLGADTAALPARYEVMPGQLGELLLLLGRRLGRELPRGAPPPAYTMAELDELPPAPDGRGWITVHLTRLAFPPQCCNCGERTQRTMSFQVAARGDALLSILVPTNEPLEVEIPVCEACQQRLRERQRRGGVLGMQAGAFVSCVLALVLAWTQGWQDRSVLLVIALATLAVGGLGGFVIGTLASKQLPAELSGYSPGRGTLSLRFRHPEYAARVLAAMRAQSGNKR